MEDSIAKLQNSIYEIENHLKLYQTRLHLQNELLVAEKVNYPFDQS